MDMYTRQIYRSQGSEEQNYVRDMEVLILVNELNTVEMKMQRAGQGLHSIIGETKATSRQNVTAAMVKQVGIRMRMHDVQRSVTTAKSMSNRILIPLQIDTTTNGTFYFY